MDNPEKTSVEAHCQFAFISRHTKAVTSPTPHSHVCTEIVHNTGTGWIHVEGRKLRYLPNQAIVYQPGPTHWAEDEPDHLGRHLCLGVKGGGAEGLAPEVYNLDENLTLLFKLVENTLANAKNARFQKERLDMLCSLVCLALGDVAARGDDDAEGGSPHARRAKALLDTRFKESLTIDDMASNVYISGDHLRYVFKREYGVSPIHYLVNKRIELAQTHLRGTSRSVADVARLCGFADPFYFSRVFKKVTGMSPQKFRGNEETSDITS